MTEERASVPMSDDTPLDQAVPSNSKYLSKEDVAQPMLVHIYMMTTDEVEGDNNQIEQRAVLHFHGDVKPFILNQTNKELLKAVLGAETIGQIRNRQVILYNDPTIMFGRKMVGGIRIRSAEAPPAAAPYDPQALTAGAPSPYPPSTTAAPIPGPQDPGTVAQPGTGPDDFNDDIPY